jgi:DNA-binding PadR family transcriptional regulator
MRYPFLALLAQRPAHGYDLKQQLEETFGEVLPPLNAGQVYTTLARLERDGLVRGDEVPEDARNKRVYELTAAGVEALREWAEAPSPAVKVKDEFFMKLVLAAKTGIADSKGLVDRQRREYLQALRDLEDVAARRDGTLDAAAALLIEGAALHLDADLKWLDRCEERLTKEESDERRARGT